MTIEAQILEILKEFREALAHSIPQIDTTVASILALIQPLHNAAIDEKNASVVIDPKLNKKVTNIVNNALDAGRCGLAVDALMLLFAENTPVAVPNDKNAPTTRLVISRPVDNYYCWNPTRVGALIICTEIFATLPVFDNCHIEPGKEPITVEIQDAFVHVEDEE